ncbi:hypothetical protein PHYSODRAFT_503879 [Phytophthora sojae]|uniref:Uncharacterized protein n=1 Tax=Phytophthora sojae (strain P6497) TaxID=1094619 RepID=G4ZGS2_PHYSP|nr:hypothetical protein PHYSODRAFT_503879 [Phytophthora sojae]EGZ17571.1 hypothetical protein PHYSODRAFT_503879 [Phytophthora sojae]|eukprot:XP_009526629.1 hypothetical protein PHYSODRAFT_503879 [Phytophthora sojae]
MWSSREFVDFIPAVVSLTVDLFSALFVSVFISSAGPLYLSFLFIAVLDLGEAALELREVQTNATAVLKNLQDQGDSSDSCRAKAKKLDKSSEKPDLLAKITAVTQNPTAFDVVSMKRTRLWACLPHTLTSDQAKQFSGVRGIGFIPLNRSLIVTKSGWIPVKTESKHKSTSSVKTKSNDNKTKSGENSRRLVVQSLQLLFHCEYLAWVEYVECVVPLVFVTYKLVLHQLPNAAYYPDTQGDWNTAALINMLVFAALEVGSLLLLHHSLQRKFAFSPLYQLAFALETQMFLVQAGLFLEIVVLLPYELVHFGADFTFQFEWLHPRK